ncbi:MAG: class I SAM-dependent methyltransferase, partial [Sporichthyaceae bacterium]|nr:class I SAM-dependent methyltransferase [Sporichthyaceae bacterium]
MLWAAVCGVLRDLPEGHVVEVGSYRGRSTVLLASAMRALRPTGRVAAIDPHEGVISLAGRPDRHGSPTYEAFQANVAAAGLTDFVEVIRTPSTHVVWDRPIGLLFIDG